MRVTVVVSGIPRDVSLPNLAKHFDSLFDTKDVGTFRLRELDHYSNSKRHIAIDFESGFDAMSVQPLLNGFHYQLANGEDYVLKAKISNDPECSPWASSSLTNAEDPHGFYRECYSDLVPYSSISLEDMKTYHAKLDAQYTLLKKQKLVLQAERDLIRERKRLQRDLETLGTDSDSEEERYKRRRRKYGRSSSNDSLLRKHRANRSRSRTTEHQIYVERHRSPLHTTSWLSSKRRYVSPPTSSRARRSRSRGYRSPKLRELRTSVTRHVERERDRTPFSSHRRVRTPPLRHSGSKRSRSREYRSSKIREIRSSESRPVEIKEKSPVKLNIVVAPTDKSVKKSKNKIIIIDITDEILGSNKPCDTAVTPVVPTAEDSDLDKKDNEIWDAIDEAFENVHVDLLPDEDNDTTTPLTATEEKTESSRQLPINPLFVVPIKFLMKQMRKLVEKKEEDCDNLFQVTRTVLRERLKSLLVGKDHMGSAKIVKLYRESYPRSGDEEFLAGLVADIKSGKYEASIVEKGMEKNVDESAVTDSVNVDNSAREVDGSKMVPIETKDILCCINEVVSMICSNGNSN